MGRSSSSNRSDQARVPSTPQANAHPPTPLGHPVPSAARPARAPGAAAGPHELPVFILTGPTGAGKTDWALGLAESAPVEIVSVDSALALYVFSLRNLATYPHPVRIAALNLIADQGKLRHLTIQP